MRTLAATSCTRWFAEPLCGTVVREAARPRSDTADASATLLYDAPGDAWHAGVVETIGLRRESSPSVRSSGDIAGGLRADAADDLGLRAGIPVATASALYPDRR